jgi:hypothetical protein
MPAEASCKAASHPASPPPIIFTECGFVAFMPPNDVAASVTADAGIDVPVQHIKKRRLYFRFILKAFS